MSSSAASSARAPRVDSVLSRLEAEIVEGVLAPGQKVSEAELAARFGTGRAPIREALRTLESRRLLQRVPFAGMRVVQLSKEDVASLLRIRGALEGLAAREAAERIDADGRARLERAMAVEGDLVAEGVGAVFRRGSQDNGFHETVAGLSGNDWLQAMLMGDLYALLRTVRFRSASDRTRLGAAHAEHVEIAAAIAGGDPAAAERLMRDHVARSLAHLTRG